MVTKLLIALLLAASPCLAGSQQIRNVIGMAIAASSTCSSTACINAASNNTSRQDLAQSADNIYVGGPYAGASTLSVCRVDVYGDQFGNVDSHNFRVEIWTASGTDMGSVKGVSDWVSGTLISATGTDAYVTYSFSAPVTVNTGDIVVIYDDTFDASNSARIRYGTVVANTLYFGRYRTDGVRAYGSIAYSVNFKLYCTE